MRDLDEQLVPGYHTLNVIGLTPGRRGLLYHRLLSSQAPDFGSRPAEVRASALDGEPGTDGAQGAQKSDLEAFQWV